jgi:DNA replication and repair protein RecF
VLVGPNGHGKTSFLEALLYLEVFRSFRGARERELARFGADGFRVEAEVASAATGAQGHGGAEARAAGPRNGRHTVAAGFDARTRTKRVTVDGLVAGKLAEAIGHVRGVVLSPFDVELVAGAPRERRRYLDVLLALTAPGYVEALAHFARALRQRSRARAADLPVWEALMARAGSEVAAARRRWVTTGAERYRERCAAMGERADPRLAYAAGGPESAAELEDALRLGRDRDFATGRTAAAALAEARGEAAAICLDDAFAELDGERSARLGAMVSDLLREGSQVFATVPRDGEMPEAVRALPKWGIAEGVMRPA